MKSLLMFWREVLNELGTWCGVSTDEDFKTVLARFEQEGDEFLTIALPAFGRDFERSLAQWHVTPDLFVGFKKRGKLPVFLGGFLELLFDRNTGLFLNIPEEELPSVANVVFAVRQLTLMFGKIEKPCTPERVEAAFASYVETDMELKECWSQVPTEKLRRFRDTASFLFRHVFTSLDNEVYNEREFIDNERFTLKPKHGPGSTADRLLGNEKFDQYEWTERLERVFPFGEYAIPSWRYYYLLDHVQFLAPGAERPVRVVAVPKTQKTPRIIAIEPTCMQYMQQAISQRFVDLLESDTIVRGMIGFTDQVPNQELASYGSLKGELASLDLSEASDRVSWPLVKELFGTHYQIYDAVDATRSTRADVPGHGIVSLFKYASMGSALCFPIEAMVFLTICIMTIAERQNRPVNASLVSELRSCVRVYGDDIIVPAEFATDVKANLEVFNFKVNANKSFWTGRFRESCGAEFFAGEDVSITRVRREFPQSRHDVPEVISTVSLRNQLYWAGLWKSAAVLDELLGGVLPHFPVVADTSPALGRNSFLGYETQRMSSTLHAPLVRGYVVDSLIPKSDISGEGALLKCLLHEGEPLDIRHLERQGRPDAVRLKLRWVQSF